MKKIQKKLSLKKKTISQLTNNQMQKVIGGKTQDCQFDDVDLYTNVCVTGGLKTQTCRTYCPDAQGNYC